MDPSNLPLYLGAAATAYGMSQFPLTPLSAAAVGGVAGGIIKRAYDEIHSQEDTQHPDYWYAVPPSKRLRGYSQDNMDVEQNFTNLKMPYPRSSRVGVKRFKKKVSWKRRSWNRGSKYPRKKGGVSTVALSQPAALHGRKLAVKTISTTTYNFDTTGTVTLLNGLTVGSTQIGDRVGRDVYMLELLVNGFVRNQTTAGTNLARLIIVVDTMCRQANIALSDVLDSNNSFAFINKLTAKRFKILYDENIVLQGVPTTTGTDACKTVGLRIPLKMSAYFNDNVAGNASDFEQNAIFAITIGSTAAGTAAAEGYLGYQLTYIAQ